MSGVTAPTLDATPAESYRFDPLTSVEAARWDQLITPYDGRTLFHQSMWLDYLAASRRVETARWAIRTEDRTVGYLCGGFLQMGPYRILGTPLRSWGTNVMGPLLDHDADQTALFRALDRLAAADRLAMIELEHPSLSPRLLQSFGFAPVEDWTYRVTLDEPNAMWRRLESTCRNRIRKAQTAGLVVEDTDDPAVADEYYDFYLDLMRRKGRRPPFSRETPRLLFSHLKKADCLFALRVRDAAGRLLAVGLFPHDEHAMYFWSGASREESHPLCPNDHMQWVAMGLGAGHGLRLYNMSGHGRFKRKFGGTLTAVARWHKCYWRTAKWARKGYQLWAETSAARMPWRPTTPRSSEPKRAAPARRSVEIVTTSQRPSFRPSDIFKAPLHDFPIRDEILYQYLSLSPDMDVLEVGPGSGVTAFRVARRLRSLTLVDIAAANIAHLRGALGGQPNIRFVRADVCQPGLGALLGRTFDAAYAIEVFELLPDPEQCLRNLAAVIRPGGRLLLQFPNYPPSLSPGMTHFRTKAELGRLLQRAGFGEWSVCSLRLRRHAWLLYEHLHERPIRAYRRHRSPNGHDRPLIYDESWAFQHGRRLEPFKYALHAAWAALSAAMRAGGPAFDHAAVGDDILNRNLIVLARRSRGRARPLDRDA